MSQSLKVGDLVRKRAGYEYPGIVVSVFTMRAGAVRYVVEADHPGFAGTLHIFNGDQLDLGPNAHHWSRDQDVGRCPRGARFLCHDFVNSRHRGFISAASLLLRQHSLEGDFDELFRKGQSRHTDQIARALRAHGSVGFLAHLAEDGKRRIHIEDIERILNDVVQRCPEARQKLDCIGVGRPHLLFHHRELGRLAGFIERSGRDQLPLLVVAELAGDMDSVTNLDRLCVSGSIFPRHIEIGGPFGNSNPQAFLQSSCEVVRNSQRSKEYLEIAQTLLRAAKP